MSATTRNILPELEARGLVADISNPDALAAALAAGNVPHYAGHDPTATSLHLGHLVPLVIQRRLQLAGHRPIVVVGGATGMIGDPSGKSDERQLLDRDTLAANVEGIRTQIARFLDFDPGASGAVMTNNADWFAEISFVDFLREVGKHLTINYMMAKESVRSRLEDRDQGISYTEFSYMLLQAWDFVVLSRRLDCRLQVGGSDQWGNITAGIELSRKLGGHQLFGVTAPLLLDSTGQKMGKTASGDKLWLDPDKTTPYAFYQYFLNVDDVLAPSLLRKFSFRPLGELDEVVTAHELDPAKRLAQRELARDITRWVHGDAGLRRAEVATKLMFGGSLTDLHDADLDPLAAEIGCTDVARTELETGVALVDMLVRVGLASSKGDARRVLGQGGISVGESRAVDAELRVTTADLGTASYLLLRKGKGTYRLVRSV
jgi:tyrosyl-tRNA synthetase